MFTVCLEAQATSRKFHSLQKTNQNNYRTSNHIYFKCNFNQYLKENLISLKLSESTTTRIKLHWTTSEGYYCVDNLPKWLICLKSWHCQGLYTPLIKNITTTGLQKRQHIFKVHDTVHWQCFKWSYCFLENAEKMIMIIIMKQILPSFGKLCQWHTNTFWHDNLEK